MYVCPAAISIGSGTGCMVNVQWMVEDVFEGKFRQAESYMRQKIAEEGIMLEDSSSNWMSLTVY